MPVISSRFIIQRILFLHFVFIIDYFLYEYLVAIRVFFFGGRIFQLVALKGLALRTQIKHIVSHESLKLINSRLCNICSYIFFVLCVVFKEIIGGAGVIGRCSY